jgi:hypothetical protein
MLIKNRSSHNFIDTEVAKQLNMFIYPSSDLQVIILGNQTTLCTGKCHKVKLSIKDYQLQAPMYAMEIGGVDVVLGAQWLSTIGTVGLNLHKQFLEFFENGRKYKFNGIKSPPHQIISSNRMEKMIKKGAQTYLFHCCSMEAFSNDLMFLKVLMRFLENIVPFFKTYFGVSLQHDLETTL